MGALLTRRHGIVGARRQAGFFHARQRRRSHRDPASALFVTHRFPAGSSDIDTDAVFPARNKPISFATAIRRTGAGSAGVIFEFGDTNRGVAAGIDGDSIVFAAGADALDSDGVDARANVALPGVGRVYRLVFAVNPGTGTVNFWVNGQIAGAGQSVAENLGVGWAGIANGAIGQVNGTITDRIPPAFRVALVDAVIAEPVRVFVGQVPRQFRDFTIGTEAGSGSWSATFDPAIGG